MMAGARHFSLLKFYHIFIASSGKLFTSSSSRSLAHKFTPSSYKHNKYFKSILISQCGVLTKVKNKNLQGTKNLTPN